MICVMCKHGRTSPGTATMRFDELVAVIVIRNVPAEVCENCGEAYFGPRYWSVTRKNHGTATRRLSSKCGSL